FSDIHRFPSHSSAAPALSSRRSVKDVPVHFVKDVMNLNKQRARRGPRFCVAQLMLKALTIVSDDEGCK
ncbi:MAG TPA: hypothetical protein VGH51_00005, partial [Candidatus Angelobacter sp.]